MLILKYFFFVGVALTLGLFALSAHLESENIAKGPRIHTTSTIAVAPTPKEAVAEASLINEQIAPPQKEKPSKPVRHSGSSHRRAAH